MRCAHLRSACLVLHEPQPCSSTCGVERHRVVEPRLRPFHIDVQTEDASAQIARATATLRELRDPVDSFRFRHIEYDLFARPNRTTRSTTRMTLLWPAWEGGFGDPFMWTLIPLGHLLAHGTLPNTTLGISGALYTGMWAPLQATGRHVCTFERGDRYDDVAVRQPLPRCARRSCHSTLSLCMPPAVSHADSWRAVAALDAQLGLPVPRLSEAAIASTTTMHTSPSSSSSAHGHRHRSPVAQRRRVLRVLFARRTSWHGRNLLNLDELVARCNGAGAGGGAGVGSSDAGALPGGWVLRCEARALGGLPLATAAALVREVDVFVSMHGADVINGLHMAPGRAVVEVVNHGFDAWPDGAPYWFVHCFWLHTTPVLNWKRIVLPPPPPPPADGPGRPGGAGNNGLSAWNRNASLPWSLLRRVLVSVVAPDGDSGGGGGGGGAGGDGGGAGGGSGDDVHSRGTSVTDVAHGGAAQSQVFFAEEDGGFEGRVGYCAVTAAPDAPGGAGDCTHGAPPAGARQGSFAAAAAKRSLRGCMAACRACPASCCRFVSYSVVLGDCSWFAACSRYAALQLEPQGHLFLTVRVRRGGGGSTGVVRALRSGPNATLAAAGRRCFGDRL